MIAVVSASLSESSTTQQLGRAMAEAYVSAHGGQVQMISLRELAHDVTDAMLTGFPLPALAKAFEQVRGAEALIAVTPAYNASYSGLFKSFFDVLPEGYLAGKPVAIGATGGTPRHSLVTEHAIRPMMTYLHANVVTTAVYAATEDFGAHAADSDAEGGASLRRRIRRAMDELAVIAQAGRPAGSLVAGQAGAGDGVVGAGQAGSGAGAGAGVVNAADSQPVDSQSDDVAEAKALFADFTPMSDLLGD
ncbi:FMN reductase (NADPH) [Trueperella bernardiae]|uniref:FMN reductase (NADPH) n=1 Tax=Trueperella bernardiae TaxID=59561 RepID=A0A0W1KK90_9ACTO|nr:CE1759 family FMN reductase [Trueperella bernardiae]KTF04417.1 FMN reductase (NADPH) [Trueperella bernardiae]WIM07393.1 NAD(P)H-dependent oxidoreductase [Trueperella bernardiae]